MGLTKSPNNSGGLWMWHCYVTVCKEIYSQLLSSVSFPSPFLQSVSFLSLYLFHFIHFAPFHISHNLVSFLSHSSLPTFSSSIYTFFSTSAPSPRPPPFFTFTQLHQLRRHMSATTIMPSEGTTEDGEGDWAGEGGVSWGGAKAKEEAVIQSLLAWELAARSNAQWNPSMRHFVLFRIKPQRVGTT